MVDRKIRERAGIEEELLQSGIHYTPMVASHFGSLHGTLDDWITRIAKGFGAKRGGAWSAVDRQLRGRLGAALARRAARMSLGTWARRQGEHEVVLPIVEYDDLDRSHRAETGGPQAEQDRSPRSAGEPDAEPDLANLTGAFVTFDLGNMGTRGTRGMVK